MLWDLVVSGILAQSIRSKCVGEFRGWSHCHQSFAGPQPWRHQSRWILTWEVSRSLRPRLDPMRHFWWSRPWEVVFRNAWAVMPSQSTRWHLSARTRWMATESVTWQCPFQMYCMPPRSPVVVAGFAILQDATSNCRSQRGEDPVVRKYCTTTSLSLALHSS